MIQPLMRPFRWLRLMFEIECGNFAAPLAISALVRVDMQKRNAFVGFSTNIRRPTKMSARSFSCQKAHMIRKSDHEQSVFVHQRNHPVLPTQKVKRSSTHRIRKSRSSLAHRALLIFEKATAHCFCSMKIAEMVPRKTLVCDPWGMPSFCCTNSPLLFLSPNSTIACYKSRVTRLMISEIRIKIHPFA